MRCWTIAAYKKFNNVHCYGCLLKKKRLTKKEKNNCDNWAATNSSELNFFRSVDVCQRTCTRSLTRHQLIYHFRFLFRGAMQWFEYFVWWIFQYWMNAQTRWLVTHWNSDCNYFWNVVLKLCTCRTDNNKKMWKNKTVSPSLRWENSKICANCQGFKASPQNASLKNLLNRVSFNLESFCVLLQKSLKNPVNLNVNFDNFNTLSTVDSY